MDRCDSSEKQKIGYWKNRHGWVWTTINWPDGVYRWLEFTAFPTKKALFQALDSYAMYASFERVRLKQFDGTEV